MNARLLKALPRCTQADMHIKKGCLYNRRLVGHLTMRCFPLALVFFVCVAKSYGQTGTIRSGGIVVEITKEKKPKRIYAKVEITSAFPGGDSSFIQSVEKELNQSIPFKNGTKEGKYIVSVKFLIERDSSISDIRCVNDPGFGMYEPVRVAILRNFAKWQKSSPVKVRQYHSTSTAQKEK